MCIKVLDKTGYSISDNPIRFNQFLTRFISKIIYFLLLKSNLSDINGNKIVEEAYRDPLMIS